MGPGQDRCSLYFMGRFTMADNMGTKNHACCDSSFHEQFGGYLCFSVYHYSECPPHEQLFHQYSQPLKNIMSSCSPKQHAQGRS